MRAEHFFPVFICEIKKDAKSRNYLEREGKNMIEEGMKVRIKSYEEMCRHNKVDKYGDIEFGDGNIVFMKEMAKFCGRKATVNGVNDDGVVLLDFENMKDHPDTYEYTTDMIVEDRSMSEERMRNLLEMVVNHVCVARSSKEAIQKLLFIGFTADELTGVYGFSAEDVTDAEQSMDEYED